MSAPWRDRFGVAVQASSEAAVGLLDQAVLDLVRLVGEPLALAERAAALDPDLALGRALTAYLHLYAASEQEDATARRLLDEAPASRPREQAHLAAAAAWAAGELERAVRLLELALLEDPRDLLALKIAQDLYLALGDRVNLRDVAARVLPAWPEEAAGAGYVLAMHAFGLEECGEYNRSLEQAWRALGADPADVWATHAVLHVYEMEGRPSAGRRLVEETSSSWSGSYFAVHNWWHAALFDLSLGDEAAALRRYDGPVRRGEGATPLANLDAASLLWRLSLLGVPAGERALELVGLFEPSIGDSTACFNDWHAAMAFGLAGRGEMTAALLDDLALRPRGTNRQALDVAGRDLLHGFAAFSAGRFAQAVEWLLGARSRAQLVGGSHAQRDVLDLTLLAAASAAGEGRLVRALLAERAARSESAATLGRRVAEANRPPRRRAGEAPPDDTLAGEAPPDAPDDAPALRASSDDTLGGKGPGHAAPAGGAGADALEAFGEFELLEEEAVELGLGWQGQPSVRRERIETAEGTLSALVWGDAPPGVVLLHGLALNAHTWDAVALALGRPAVAIDLPGHGESSWREDGRYQAATIATAVARAVESLARRRATVVGQSLGGLTAIELARLEPGLVARLVLVDISPGLQARRATSVRAFLDGPQVFASREEIVERAFAFGYGRSRAALERGVWHNTTRRPDGSVVWKHHVGQLPGGGEAPASLTELWEPLERFEGEVLLVWAEDGFLGEERAEELCRRVPRARAVRLPGGHNVQEFQPLRLAAILANVLDARVGDSEAGGARSADG